MKVVILKGLPASGKSTWAKAKCAEDETYRRVNKDTIRDTLGVDGPNWDRKKEKTLVIPERNRQIAEHLANGLNVIVDDTNLEHFHQNEIKQIAKPFGAEVEVKFFDVDVEECVTRDDLRTGKAKVGEKVIRDMATRLMGIANVRVQPFPVIEGLPKAVICDLDGTLALNNHGRSFYDASTCDEDDLNHPVKYVLEAIVHHPEPPKIFFVSGREDKFEEPTRRFIDKHWPYDYTLIMRKTGDKRKDSVVKDDIIDEHFRGKYNILVCLDDRNQVVNHFRSLGLSVFQVAPGEF